LPFIVQPKGFALWIEVGDEALDPLPERLWVPRPWPTTPRPQFWDSCGKGDSVSVLGPI